MLAVVVGLSLSACSSHPGDAAVVGSESISQGHLDRAARALCAVQAASAQSGGQQTAARPVRQSALSVLVDSSLSTQYGESVGISPDQAQLSAAMSSYQTNIDQVAASQRSAFSDLLRSYVEGQLVLFTAGRRQLAEQGTAKPTQAQAVAAGTKLRDAWAAEHGKVVVDPRYGSFSNGRLVPASGSLSTAVSASATAGSKAQPAAAWVSALPANLTCT
jgi:hypothetical protein